jgi:hypothetical protein
MTTATRTNLQAQLKFLLHYELEDAEIRPAPYRSDRFKYKPTHLNFTLACSAIDGHPKCEDLQVSGVVLYGRKLKKDGTVGKAEASENFYGEIPGWIAKVIAEALAGLVEGVS